MKNKNKLFVVLGSVLLLALVSTLVYISNYRKLDHLPLPQLTNTVGKDEAEVELTTTEGKIRIKLFPKLAPKATENFLTLAKEEYFDENEFFRVIDNFMIQTGSKDNSPEGESASIFGEPFANEISDQLYHIRGAVALANSGQDGTNGSQFFIVQNSNDMSSQINFDAYPTRIAEAYKKGGSPALDAKYTVFAQVISGMSVVDKIAKGEVIDTEDDESGQRETSKPVKPVKITKVTIIKDWNFDK